MNPKPPKLRSIIGHKALDTCFLCIKDSKWGGIQNLGRVFAPALGGSFKSKKFFY